MADTNQQLSDLLKNLENFSGKTVELKPQIDALKTAIEQLFSNSGKSSGKLLSGVEQSFKDAQTVAKNYYEVIQGGTAAAIADQKKFQTVLAETKAAIERTQQYATRGYLAGAGISGPTAKQAMTSSGTPPDDDLIKKSNALADTLHKEALTESGEFLSQLETKLASSYDKQISTVHTAVSKLEAAYKQQAKAGGLSEEERTAGEAKLAYYKDLDARLLKARELSRSEQISNAEYINQVSPYASPLAGQNFPSLSPLTGAIKAETQAASILAKNPKVDPAVEARLKDIQEQVYWYILSNVKVVKQNLIENLTISAKEAQQAINELLSTNSIVQQGRNFSAGPNARPVPAGGPPGGYTPPPLPEPKSLSDLSQEQQTTLLSGAGITSLFKDTAKLDAFKTKLDGMGLSFKNITSITKEMSTGVSTVNFSTFDKATGSVKNLTAHIGSLGNVLNDTSNRFQSFSEKVGNNIVKVLQYSIAIGLVYGSISKLSQVITEMTKIQEEMATISITTNAVGPALQKFFEQAAAAAQTAGVPITDAITAFNAALKVTGNSGTEFERASTAASLLASSLALAKIGGITVKESMDSLTAALEQSGLKLNQGTFLLNKFIAVAKVSAGTAKDFADTFGITAGSAADVGVEVDQLTALIGAFAAATTLSSDQTGNALRAMFANFTTDKTANVLNKYGIAVKDLSGEFLSFTDVLDVVSEKIKSGLLDNRAIAEIANSLGGGSRRGAQVTALISQWDSYGNILKIAQGANETTGQTQDALNKVTDTLNTAVDRLGNSFISLSATLGTKGGLLDFLSGLVNILTSAVSVVTGLTSTLGPATTALLVFGLASAVASSSVGQRMIGSAMNSPVLGGLFNKGSGANSQLTYDANGTVTGITSAAPNIGKQIGAAMLPVLITGAAQMGDALKSGDWSGIAATVIGGGFMAVVTKSSGWATVGIILANIIATEINAILQHNNAVQNNLKEGPLTFADAKKLNPNLTASEYINTQVNKVNETIAPTTGEALLGGQLNVDLAQKQKNLLYNSFGKERVQGALGGTLPEIAPTAADTPEQRVAKMNKLNEIMSEFTNKVKDAGLGNELLFNSFDLAKLDYVEQGLKNIADASKLASDGLSELNQFGFTGSETGLKALQDATSAQVVQQNATRRFDLLNQLSKGTIGGAKYQTQNEALQGTQSIAAGILAARHPEIVSNAEEAKKYTDELLKLKLVLDATTQENRDFIAATGSSITKAASGISNLKDQIIQLDALQGIAKALGLPFDDSSLIKATADLKLLTGQAAEASAQLEAAVKAAAAGPEYQFPGFTDLSKLTTPEVNKISQQAMSMQNAFAQQQGVSADVLKSSAKDIVIETANGFITIHGIYSDFFSQATQGYQDLKKAAENAFNFQTQRDTPIAALSQIQKGINYYTQMLKALGFNEQAQTLTILFKDNQLGQLTGSQTALRLALEDLTTQVKKQITGVYNLPQGATAFVPVGAAEQSANGQFSDNGAGYNQMNYGAAPPVVAGSFPQGSPDAGAVITTKIIQATLSPFEQMISKFASNISLSSFTGPSKTVNPPIEGSQKGGISTPITAAEQARLDQRRGEWKIGPATPPTSGPDLMESILKLFGLGGSAISSGLNSSKHLESLAASQTIKIDLKPQAVKHEFIALINLMLPNGQMLYNLIAPFLYEDLNKMSPSLGSSNRQSNVIIS